MPNINTSTFLKMTGRALYITGTLVAFLSPLFFQLIIVPWLGMAFIVGENFVVYNADHTKIIAFTNPGACVIWYVLISMIGCSVRLIGKKMLAAYERPTPSENRALCIILIVIVFLSLLVCQGNQ